MQAGAAAEARIVAAHTAAVADIAGPHTAAAVVALEPRTGAEAARRPAPGEGGRIREAVVATEPLGFREHIVRVAEALRPRKLLPPAPVRRRKGSLSSRGEHRVRIADISS